MPEYPDFLARLCPFGHEPSPDVLLAKFKELAIQTASLPTWSCDELRSFQKTFSRRNRYVNRLPYEQSRVKLDEDANPDYCDYINASWLQIEGDSLSYIATQAPIPRTFSDFWQMVSEQRVQVIVMLVVADGIKCERYWPEKEGEFCFATGIKVNYVGTLRQSPNKVIKEFTITDRAGKRTVRIYNFLGWPDHGIPECACPLIRFFDWIATDSLYKSPVLVHCSAGVGRTGTFCVIDTLMRMHARRDPFLDESEDPIMDLTLAFRAQRISIVETFSQFCFIYRFLLTYYQRSAQPDICGHSNSS